MSCLVSPYQHHQHLRISNIRQLYKKTFTILAISIPLLCLLCTSAFQPRDQPWYILSRQSYYLANASNKYDRVFPRLFLLFFQKWVVDLKITLPMSDPRCQLWWTFRQLCGNRANSWSCCGAQCWRVSGLTPERDKSNWDNVVVASDGEIVNMSPHSRCNMGSCPFVCHQDDY